MFIQIHSLPQSSQSTATQGDCSASCPAVPNCSVYAGATASSTSTERCPAGNTFTNATLPACVTCRSGYKLENRTCVLDPVTDASSNSTLNATAVVCADANCKTCSTATNCTACKEGYSLVCVAQ